MSESSNNSNSSVVIPAVAVGVALLGGLVFFALVGKPARVAPGRPGVPVVGGQPDAGERFSADQKRELLKLAQQAIGAMENARWRAALTTLAEIEKRFPEDPFSARNAAITVSQDVKIPSQVMPEDIQPAEAEAAIQKVLRAAPTDPISQILAARIASKMGDGQLALQFYQKAVELDPKSAVGWYELFDTLRGASWQDGDDPAKSREQQKAALRHVLEIQPHNLRATLDLLDVMVATRDVQVADVLLGMTPQMALVLRMFEEKVGNNQLKEIYEAASKDVPAAAKGNTEQDWMTIGTRIPPLINLMRSLDPVFRDMGRLKPNSLDFVQTRFLSPALNAIDLDTAESHPAIPVKFSPFADQLPVTEPPLDLKIGDYNLDQRPDLWVLTAGKLRIFGTTKESPKWVQLSELAIPEGLNRFIVQDLDWDDQTPAGVTPQPAPKSQEEDNAGKDDTASKFCHQADNDLLAFGPAGIQIWKNDSKDGNRQWILMEKTGLGHLKGVTAVGLADIDHEGDLDLAIGSDAGLQLWSNRENFQFKDVSSQSTMPDKFTVRQFITVDFDRDVDLDLLVFGDGDATVTAGMLENHLHGVMEWRTFAQQELRDVSDRLRGALLIDADRNVSWDLIGLGAKGPVLNLTQTHGPGQTTSLRAEPQPEILNGGVCSIDYDNDGYLDLVTWDAKQLKLLRGTQTSRFTPQPDILPAQAEAVEDCLPVDLDHDGDLDLAIRTTQGVQILNNEGGNANHWLDIRLRARKIVESSPSPEMALRRVNHQGLASLVEIQAGGFYLPQLVTGECTHFGLGKRESADLLRVVWTNGVPQGVLDAKSDREICEEQAPKGSCPFAYTWDGERFTFFTDLLWNAPLGLQFAEGVIAPARQWEFLKIPGERMVPRDGKYVMQITEELWEATYFDQIELLAVDHPADVEVYSNEKVGPASISEFKIHTVKAPQPVVAARDQRGRNVLQEVGVEDGEFTKSYDRVLRQGLTTEHWLELDLGKITQTGPLTLFLTGWMYPTETSISVGVSQNADNKQAHPPALWIPDASGEWREVRPFMGFPGGKTKTIAVDLTGVFAGDDHRLRIVTNMQFHWDHAFFTVGEAPVEVRTHPLKLETADLHYRGLSRHYWQPGNGPDQYDYSSVLPGPEWPPMKGMFTRYGDVCELLTKTDDFLAIVGAGDEITMTFSPPEAALPPGWKRDFILHNVGWDKDADLNTITGQRVEPMPFNAMSAYPYPPHEGPPDTDEYRKYLRDYQTRPQDYSRFWRRVQQATRRTSEVSPDDQTSPGPVVGAK